MKWLKAFGLAESGYKAFQAHKIRRVAKRFQKRAQKALEDSGMAVYSKAIAAVIGYVAGLAVTSFPFLAPLLTNDVVDAVVQGIIMLLAVIFAPKNAPA